MRNICLLLILCAGCYSWRTIPSDEIHKRIEAGDEVRVTTKNGEQTVFEVANIRQHSISGRRVRFRLAEIEKLELHRLSVLKTGLAAGGYFVLAAAVTVVVGFAVLLP